MKILIFTHFPYPHFGGISSHMTILGKGLQKIGQEVSYLSFSILPFKIGDILVRLPAFLLNIIYKGLGFYWRIWSIILIFNFITLFTQAKNKYDIINCQDVVAYNSTFLARKLLKTPVVLTVHGYLNNEIVAEGQTNSKMVSNFLQNIERVAYASADQVISVDERIQKYIVEELKIQAKIKVFPNFVDITDFHPVNKKKKNIISILCPRRLVKKNGVIFGVMAMKYLQDNYVLNVVGEGHEEAIIKEIIKREGLEKQVNLLGPKKYSDMIHYYQTSDYTLVPSITVANVEEATSISALESMASGTPVIASNIGGLKLLIKQKVNGILVQQQEPKEIAKAILYLEKNPAIKSKIKKNSVIDVKKNYSHIAAAKKFVEIYVSTLKK